jgi:hypothetical protein
MRRKTGSAVLARLVLAALLPGFALPAGAAKRVTLAQLEQALSAAATAHKPDAEIARQLSGMELSERLTDATLNRLNAPLEPGSAATLALALLADQSAFLEPPAGELPQTAAPADAEQRRMLEAARSYVAQTLPRLPNFLATRTINRYDDSPQTLKTNAWAVRAGLHLVGSSSREVSVRDERENQPPTQDSALWKEQTGLISGGEFGSTLGMILNDTVQGSMTWSHWEQAAEGQTAVFRYAVPRSASHFEIMGSVQGRAALEGHATPMGGRGVAGIGVTQSAAGSSKPHIVQSRPGYHGSLWLEPSSGTILRITIEADAKDSAPFRRAALMVVYRPVQIGDGTYICPVRSLALSDAFTDAEALSGSAPTEWLNETLFTGYHRFAATTRILTEPAAP